ncbi:MAG: TraR/DksA C4-type zinc finger protein [Ginsengibacter sp.]
MATNKKTAKTAVKKAVIKPVAHGAAKKAAPQTAKKAGTKASPKKPGLQKPVAKKLASKSKSLPSKSIKLIKKSAPVKKAAKPVAKKAVPKKLATPKKPALQTGTKLSHKPNLVKKSDVKKVANKKTELHVQLVKDLPRAKDIKVPSPKPIVLPKITTTKSRKYEPDFTKSVLDQAPHENNGPTHRYSDPELTEFRELIQRKLETAKKELGYLQGLITRKDEMGGDDTDNRYMTMEDGSLSMEREQLSQMASRQITFIDHLEKAMMRIENKTYGICRVTGKLIDKARLRAVPHATLSIEAKMGIVK